MFGRSVFNFASRASKATQRRFAGSHGHAGRWEAANKEFGVTLHEAHWFHRGAANFLLIVMWTWVMYRIREDKGKMLGWDKPWLHAHEHHDYEWVTVSESDLADEEE
jgi:hypothetical protein